MGLEGIVAKRKDSRYRSGRSSDWLKMKNPACAAVKREAEAFEPPRVRRRRFGFSHAAMTGCSRMASNVAQELNRNRLVLSMGYSEVSDILMRAPEIEHARSPNQKRRAL